MSAAHLHHTIAFDGAVLGAGPITGVAGSFLTTLRAYAASTPARCVLLAPRSVHVPELDGVEVIESACGRWSRQRVLPRVLREIGAQLLHCPVAALPLRAPCPTIATVHDLPWMASVPGDEPGCGTLDRLAVRLAARRAAAIVVPTAATARDLVQFAGARNESRVHVVPHGVRAAATPAPEDDLDGPFLVLGDDRPRKNLERVRLAHELALEDDPGLPALQLVGPGFGYLSEENKLATLRRSRALLHLSLHEGFGLPVVEAFAHGVPVLCSDIKSLREVADGAAMQISPLQLDAMASAIRRIHRDEGLRRRLRTSGLARAAMLTPENSAAGWRRVHAQVLAVPELLEV